VKTAGSPYLFAD